MKKSIEEVILETAKGLYDIGAIDAQTMHEFDVDKLTPVNNMTSTQIKKLRLREKVSQAVFAKYLNTSISTVQQWERGVKHPRGISLKMLNLIERNGLDSVA